MVWDWGIISALFQGLVIPLILYGCEVWGLCIPKSKWRHVKKVQKLGDLNSTFKKNYTQYEFCCANLNRSRLRHQLNNKTLQRWKNIWEIQRRGWLEDWGINEEACPGNREALDRHIKWWLPEGKEEQEGPEKTTVQHWTFQPRSRDRRARIPQTKHAFERKAPLGSTQDKFAKVKLWDNEMDGARGRMEQQNLPDLWLQQGRDKNTCSSTAQCIMHSRRDQG